MAIDDNYSDKDIGLNELEESFRMVRVFPVIPIFLLLLYNIFVLIDAIP